MSSVQLRKEFNAIIDREIGYARANILTWLRNNLPTSSGTLGNYIDYPSGISLAGKDLYAKGNLRNSYHEITLQPGSPYKNGRISSFVTDSDYAYYYANGRINSDTYHGFDFIEATRRDIERSLLGDHIGIRPTIW